METPRHGHHSAHIYSILLFGVSTFKVSTGLSGTISSCEVIFALSLRDDCVQDIPRIMVAVVRELKRISIMIDTQWFNAYAILLADIAR